MKEEEAYSLGKYLEQQARDEGADFVKVEFSSDAKGSFISVLIQIRYEE